jgi:hypothetical protein
VPHNNEILTKHIWNNNVRGISINTPHSQQFFVSCFYGLTFTMVPQWENKCHNKTHSTKHSSYSKKYIYSFYKLRHILTGNTLKPDWLFHMLHEHSALGKLCIWIWHWHTSNGNWFKKKKFDLVTFHWSSTSLSDDGKASGKFQTDILQKDRPTIGHTFLTRGFKSQ